MESELHRGSQLCIMRLLLLTQGISDVDKLDGKVSCVCGLPGLMIVLWLGKRMWWPGRVRNR
jgi:hypothetical protein